MIKLAFYKAQPGDIWGNAIAKWGQLWNWGAPPYCHVEIGFSYSDGWHWYSSASRNWDGTTGTRWISEKDLFKNPERWDVFEVREIRHVSEMIATCEIEKGKKYDWLGIFGFATLFGQLNQKDAWYCSEICRKVFFGDWKKRIHPIPLWKETRKYVVV